MAELEPGDAAPPEGADDLEVLVPERTVTVQGGTVTVRELDFYQTLTLGAQVNAITHALLELAEGEEDVAELGLEVIGAVVSERHGEFLTLLSATTAKEVEWLKHLSAKDGQALLMAFWEVHAPFFVQRVISSGVMRAARAMRAPPPAAGPTCSPA